MADLTPIDGEFGLDYQLHVLRMMVQELPEAVRKPMLDQLDEVAKAVIIRQKLIVSLIVPKLEDIRVDIQYMEFDRAASAREREELEDKLRDALDDNPQT